MNVLFIGGDGSMTNANSVCVNNMAHAMESRGHKVCVLSLGDGPGQVPDSYYGKLKVRVTGHPTLLKKLWLKVVDLMRHVFLLPFYPNVAPCRSRKMAKKAEELVRKNDIELVVAVFNVYENIYAGMHLKKRFGEKIKVVSYHLDLRTSSVNPSKLIRNYIYKHALTSVIKENKVVDKMLIPYSGQKDIEKLKGLDMSKVHFVGLPVFIEGNEAEKCELPFEKDAINIAYIGSLSSDNRNPGYILKLLEQAEEKLDRKIMVHVWGDVAGVEQILADSPVAAYHGKIDNRFVRYVMDNSDFVLNIGNAITYTMLPSKVFGMFATGKPIINVITHPEDATQLYFERYNNSIDVREYQENKADATFLADGVAAKLNAPLKDSKGLFDDFRPATICEIIMN